MGNLVHAHDNNPDAKKRKLTASLFQAKLGSEQIRSSNDLNRLLAFQPDDSLKLCQNIQTFKFFLESIAYPPKNAIYSERLAILLDYIRSTMPAEDKTANCLPHVIQSWSFAAQTDNDSLLSSVPAVLALLLKVISTSIDFRAFGLALCKSLLRHDQLKLFDRGLTANKTKEHLISPCLRLLTEISLFDGGSSARCLHQQRDITFKRLDIFLGMRNQSAVAPTDRPKPSIRRNALRYLLANLRLQQQCEKSDILAQGKLIRAVFQDIKKDEPEIIVEILDALRRTVLLDESLVRAAKSRLLTDWTLSRIASLYDYTEDQRTQVGQAAVQDSAHEFLMFVCTTLDHGTLLIQQGWYPPGADIFKDRPDETTDQCYPHHQRLGNKYIDKVPVCNTALASLIKRLRPHVSMRQKELILAIFSVAPELIAAYFSTKSPLSFEPKLSTAWVGWSAFIFSVVQLHPSTKFLSLTRLPPPTSIVIESIYPQTLNQNSLIRCLNQKSGLITFLATRLLILAFQKLEEVLALFRTRQHRKVWVEGASCLTIEFSQRCPGLRYVIAAFKSCSPDRILLRESLARLISLYYSVIPRLALEEKFNVSTSLAGLLDTGSEIITNSPIRKIDLLATQHLLEVACRTLNNDMKWFKKPNAARFSPFMFVLRSYISEETATQQIKDFLTFIMRNHFILQYNTPLEFDILTLSLRSMDDWKPSLSLYEFLDNCILRLVRDPVHYCGELEVSATPTDEAQLSLGKKKKGSSNLLMIAIRKQWSFFVSANSKRDVLNATSWLDRYFDICARVGEDVSHLSSIRDHLAGQTADEKCRIALQKTFSKPPLMDMASSLKFLSGEKAKLTLDEKLDPVIDEDPISLMRKVLEVELKPPAEPEDYPVLGWWTKKDIPDVLEDGDIGKLLFCLCSEHGEIRRQGMINLHVLMSKLESSGYSEWLQIYMLIGEVLETAKETIVDEPLSTFAVGLAVQALLVLRDPLHCMYEKINNSLNKSPKWNTEKLPSYWIDAVFVHPPTNDDCHYREIDWILDVLVDSLRSLGEMELYRRCGVFERIFSLSASPFVPDAIVRKTITLFYRSLFVGGSTTLVTRCGVLSWIQARLEMGGQHKIILKALSLKLASSLDKAKVARWSSGAMEII